MSDKPLRVRPIRGATATWSPSRGLKGDLAEAKKLLAREASTVVLTGAGISTDSGVPDYRGPQAAETRPMLYQEFVGGAENRRRYWARNFRGWAHMRGASPNAGHHALAQWEATGLPNALVGVITQNVDGLHEAAGTQRLITLHGRGADVVCLDCGARSTRAELQPRLAAANPEVDLSVPFEHAELRPDADAEVDEWHDFVVPPCVVCGGVLKPDVVYFGESVPADRVAKAFAWVDEADVMVVLGSSLTVMSGLRFARAIKATGKPLIVVNRGATRADDLADIRLDLSTSEFLTQIV